ncbi:toxin-activating lysine-acyltransferase [Hwanghaeella grinnelliae]|nr:toxin-activating lysine-acyltransferase [Hwanghaeella grinnelliae]
MSAATQKSPVSPEMRARMDELKPGSAEQAVPEALKKIAEQADRVTAKVEGTASNPQQTVSSVLGEIAWLMTMTPSHRYFFLADMEWLIMTPVVLAQYRLFRDDGGKPAGLVLWAKIDDETEERLKAGATRLRPQDWNSGENYWVIDILDPMGKAPQMLQEMKDTVFKGKTFKYHQTGADGKRSVVSVKSKVNVEG